MKNEKNLLRKEILSKRDSLSDEEIRSKSSDIIEKLAAIREFKDSQLIMSYVNFGSEVITQDLILKCWSIGKRVAVPVTKKSPSGEKYMDAVEILCLEKGMRRNSFGLIEPVENTGRPVPPGEIDIVMVPGVVFDMRGYRVGYGGGYYDKFLKSVRKACRKVALAFEIQLIAQVPVEKHDVGMDIIITEKRILLTKKK